MVFSEIKKLIERYENAETTLKEEDMLREYFSGDDIDPRFEAYKPMFSYFSLTQSEQFTKDVPLKPERTYRLYQWISVAAVVVIMLGLVFINPFSTTQKTYADLSPEEQREYHDAMMAFNLLSSNFKKGTDNLSAMTQLSSAMKQGEESFTRLTEFDNATDKIFKYD